MCGARPFEGPPGHCVLALQGPIGFRSRLLMRDDGLGVWSMSGICRLGCRQGNTLIRVPGSMTRRVLPRPVIVRHPVAGATRGPAGVNVNVDVSTHSEAPGAATNGSGEGGLGVYHVTMLSQTNAAVNPRLWNSPPQPRRV
jgi:hypothetical protein